MAHKTSQGSTANTRDSQSKRLGVKLFGGQLAKPGNIIIRQRGTRYLSGPNTKIGKDHTIFAIAKGQVYFTKKRVSKYDGSQKLKTTVGVKK
jgi:large subunit ribosomal protein L27